MTKEQEKPALTKWEAGNILVKAADDVCEQVKDLNGYPELQEALRDARKIIVKAFNENGMIEELGFGI